MGVRKQCPLCHGFTDVPWIDVMPSRSVVPTRLTCSQCGGVLRVGRGGNAIAMLVGLLGLFLGLGLFWSGRGGWPALIAGTVGFIAAGLLGGRALLTLEPDSKSAG